MHCHPSRAAIAWPRVDLPTFDEPPIRMTRVSPICGLYHRWKQRSANLPACRAGGNPVIASYGQGYLYLLAVWLLGSTLVAAFLWRAERHAPPAAAWILPTSLVLGVACALGLYSEPRPGQLFEDLRVAYLGGARLLLSDSLAIYREPLNTLGPPVADFFANIPIVVLPFVPLTWVSERAAIWIFLGLGVASTSLAALGLHRLTRPVAARSLWIPALFLVCGPLYNSLREGNTTHLILAALSSHAQHDP